MCHDGVCLIITFPTTFMALAFEEAGAMFDLDLELVQAPGNISATCSLAVQMSLKDTEKARQLCQGKRILYEHFFRYDPTGPPKKLFDGNT